MVRARIGATPTASTPVIPDIGVRTGSRRQASWDGLTLSNFDGTTTPVLKPWVAGRTFAKFVSTRVRAWVGQSLYNQTNNTWGSITWHPAQALTYRVGDGAGFCGL